MIAQIDLSAFYIIAGSILVLKASIFGAFFSEHIAKRK
jgi:hypothetical protein